MKERNPSVILEDIHSPQDVKALPNDQLPQLCRELRQFLVDSVSQTGGHLASNLGAVELTVAIHRCFDTERDRLVFDVGHQCYVHKALTGRRELFSTLRQLDGLSGFPKPRESVHDAFIAGHASNSVSVALGMARARSLQHQDYQVLALIGDGALSGGLAYEGLNDAGASGEPLIVILNDNGMSINPNVGAVSEHLERLRSRPAYYHFKKWYRSLFGKHPAKNPLYRFNHRVKTFLKRSLYPSSSLFEDMGFTYLGPVDGHDLPRLCNTLEWARELQGPVLVHVRTVKGKGCAYAERNPGRYHGVGPFDPETGVIPPSGESFSSVFGRTLEDCAAQDPRVCAVTAAMADGTGLGHFAGAYPDRFFDVGIAEGHGAAMAAGLARQGMLPVFAVYSSFLQRSYDMRSTTSPFRGSTWCWGWIGPVSWAPTARPTTAASTPSSSRRSRALPSTAPQASPSSGGCCGTPSSAAPALRPSATPGAGRGTTARTPGRMPLPACGRAATPPSSPTASW